MPRSIQFDESSEEYRCLCNCFHVKTGAYLIGAVHVLMILFFLTHSLLVYFQHDGRLQDVSVELFFSIFSFPFFLRGFPFCIKMLSWVFWKSQISTNISGTRSERELCIRFFSYWNDRLGLRVFRRISSLHWSLEESSTVAYSAYCRSGSFFQNFLPSLQVLLSTFGYIIFFRIRIASVSDFAWALCLSHILLL